VRQVGNQSKLYDDARSTSHQVFRLFATEKNDHSDVTHSPLSYLL